METQTGRTFSGRLPHGSDLLEALTAFCRENDIRHGALQALGALTRATVSFYDQKEQTYRDIALDRPMELLSLTGNVSLKDGGPFVHAHVVLADEQGRAFGGHVVQGCRIFACEFAVQEWLSDPPPERRPDPVTGLALWP